MSPPAEEGGDEAEEGEEGREIKGRVQKWPHDLQASSSSSSELHDTANRGQQDYISLRKGK